MKELSKFQMAAVKRTAQSVKSLRTKKSKLEEKQAKLTEEINELEELIMVWEEPVMRMTGGFTSEQILNGEATITPVNAQDIEGGLDDSPLDTLLVEGTTPTSESLKQTEEDDLPFGM